MIIPRGGVVQMTLGEFDEQEGGDSDSDGESKEGTQSKQSSGSKFNDKLQEFIDNGKLDKVIEKAMNKAQQQMQKHEQLMQQLPGGYGPSPGDLENPAKIADVQSKLDKMLSTGDWRKLLEIIGRMSLKLHKKLKESKADVDVPYGAIYDVSPSDRLASLLPSELALLDIAPDIFMAKYASKLLLSFRKKCQVNAGKGPIVILLDSTGSMLWGDRHLWAKALAWVLLDLAQNQGRDCAILHYGRGVRQEFFFEGRRKPEISKIFDCFTYFAHDGTNWEPAAFERAVEVIETNPVYNKSDIIFITDGGCEFDSFGYLPSKYVGKKSLSGKEPTKDNWISVFNDKREKLKFGVYTILIEGHANVLKQILKPEDPYMDIRDLSKDATQVEEKLFSLLSNTKETSGSVDISKISSAD